LERGVREAEKQPSISRQSPAGARGLMPATESAKRGGAKVRPWEGWARERGIILRSDGGEQGQRSGGGIEG
jgi:hypothetical protein